MRALLLALAIVTGCTATTFGRDDCAPAVIEIAQAPPAACNVADGYRCCVWAWGGCLHTFCESQFACEWDYRGNSGSDCKTPDGYVWLTVTRPEMSRAIVPNVPRPIR